MKQWVRASALTVGVGSLGAAALFVPAPAVADDVGYLVNVTVRPGYNFPNADAALSYGYGLCDGIRAGQGYPQLAQRIRSDFTTTDELQVSYLLSQATQELCPAQIWQLRQSAADYRPPPPA